MDIKRSGSQPSGRGPAECLTGTVRVDPLERLDGNTADWMEQVSDEQYQAR
jgi:hypothetical protein